MGAGNEALRGANQKAAINTFLETINEEQFNQFIEKEEVKKFFEAQGLGPDDVTNLSEAENEIQSMYEDAIKELYQLMNR